MTSAAETVSVDHVDWRTVVAAGAKMGAVTAVGVVAFALLSRGMAGTAETVVQSILVLAGGVVFAYGPSVLMRPHDTDSIAWVSLIGLLGSLFFTVVDTVVLRPIQLYHWTWDAIGGGSGFWYIPVWWMGSAVLAWLGAWVTANRGTRGDANLPVVAGQSVAVGVVMALIITALWLPFHAGTVALGFAIGMALHVPLSAVLHKG